MPSADTIVLLDAPARINIPNLVKFTSQSRPKAASSPTIKKAIPAPSVRDSNFVMTR